MSETKLFGQAHDKFYSELFDFLKKWKLIKEEFEKDISEVNIICDWDGSIINITKLYEKPEDIK